MKRYVFPGLRTVGGLVALGAWRQRIGHIIESDFLAAVGTGIGTLPRLLSGRRHIKLHSGLFHTGIPH